MIRSGTKGKWGKLMKFIKSSVNRKTADEIKMNAKPVTLSLIEDLSMK
jgi:hypothetical protein